MNHSGIITKYAKIVLQEILLIMTLLRQLFHIDTLENTSIILKKEHPTVSSLIGDGIRSTHAYLSTSIT